ncbi:hypothetical protein BHM03_00057877 [Ensete ventricosum]|nr:hypothetical protein BHM03_00057877 [Ensete ventricosum]
MDNGTISALDVETKTWLTVLRASPLRVRREMADSSVAITLRPPTAAASPWKTRMHRLIEEEGIVLMPGIYDALSAAVLQSLGFRAGFVSGYAVSASRLGMPDIGLLTYLSLASQLPSFSLAHLGFLSSIYDSFLLER